MRLVRFCLVLPFLLFRLWPGNRKPETGPSNEKAKKSFKEGLAYLNQHKQQSRARVFPSGPR